MEGQAHAECGAKLLERRTRWSLHGNGDRLPLDMEANSSIGYYNKPLQLWRL